MMEEQKQTRSAIKAFAMAPQFADEYWWWAKHEPTPPNCQRNSGYDSDAAAWGKYDTAKAIHDSIVSALEKAREGDIKPLLEWITERLKKCKVRATYGCLHNQDQKEIIDFITGMKTIKDESIHLQIVVLFMPSKQYNVERTVKKIASALGLTENTIRKPDRGRYWTDNQLAYLIHAKDLEKHPYSPQDVVSIIPEGSDGEPYMTIYERRSADWRRGRGMVSKKKSEVNVESLVDDISDGKITKQHILMDSNMRRTYTRHRGKIDDAFNVYMDYKVRLIIQEMRAGKFRLSVFFVTGEVGNGKTLFAEFFSECMVLYYKEKRNEDWQIYNAAASNSMDDYRGEEILILDDLRAGAMLVEDWLNILDNHRTKAASARFYNKTPICKTLVITSYKDPVTFFNALAIAHNEDMNQFIRRITALVEVINTGESFKDARLHVFLSQKVEPYRHEFLKHLLKYKFISDGREYEPIGAVKRLMRIIKNSLKPAPSPFPEGWKEAVLDDDDDDECLEVEMEQLSLFSERIVDLY